MSILITGASGGIGGALALEYGRRAKEVVLLSRNVKILEELTGKINNSGGRAYFLKCDVTNPDDIKNGVSFAVEQTGRIDIAVLNSGIGGPLSFNNLDIDYFIETFRVNLFGIAYGLHTLIPLMKTWGGGKIVGISSMADVRGFPGTASYCSSKAAATKMLESARAELSGSGIDIITVRPGFIRTPMTDRNKFYMPFLMDVEKAVKIITKGIDQGKSRIYFPQPMVLLTYLLRSLPDSLYDAVIDRFKDVAV